MIQSCDKRIDCDVNLLTNYSSEGAEPYPPYYAVVFPPITDIPLDQEWSMPGCLYVYVSYISQEDANLGALRQAALCINGPPGQEIWYSAPASCTTACPDGTSAYTYLVPAGTFISDTYDKALAQAQAYACEQAQKTRVCFNLPPGDGGGGGGGGNVALGILPRCACKGVGYSGTIEANGATRALNWVVVGTLPPGLSFLPATTGAVIAGIPTVSGTYAFQVVATDPISGSYTIGTFTIQVVEITTTSLPDFIAGTPYSYQLAATGGSGNYAWRVATGTLPDGLSLSASGLISGTPTITAIGDTLTFEVADTTCEQIEQSANKPRIALSATSVTRNMRWLGWQAFNGEKRRFKKLEWSGTAEQYSYPLALSSASECSRAKFVYAGVSEITAAGNQISWYTKDLYTRSGDGRLSPYPYALLRDGAGGYNAAPLLGYCWDADPQSAPDCDSTNLTFAANVATNSQLDTALQFSSGVENPIYTATSFVQNDTIVWDTLVGWELTPSGPNGNFQPVTPIAPEGFPTYTLNEESGPWIHMTTETDYVGTLSEEYTDLEAYNNASVFTSNSTTAQNKPRNFSSTVVEDWFRATLTSVTYRLACSDLVVGRNYKAQVTLLRSDGASSVVATTFTAAATTHLIIGTIPTPPANMYTSVRYPVIAFA